MDRQLARALRFAVFPLPASSQISWDEAHAADSHDLPLRGAMRYASCHTTGPRRAFSNKTDK
jgi:hypothetical protein